MKIRTPFFLVVRMTLMLSALFVALEKPASADANISLTVPETKVLSASQALHLNDAAISVNDYFLMLQSGVTQSNGHALYDASSMSGQIVYVSDEEGNSSYQVVAGKGDEPMQGLTSDDISFYNLWVANNTQKETAYKISTDQQAASSQAVETTSAATTSLLFSPGQVAKINNNHQTSTNITKHLLDNTFEQKAIVAAIMSALASLGLKASAGTINTVSNVFQNAAIAFFVIAAVPVASEFIAHALEGRVRKQMLSQKGVDRQRAINLIQKEKENKAHVDALKQAGKVEGETSPMVYGYFSKSGEKCARFAMNWRTFFSPAFKLLGMNTTIDELHVSANKIYDDTDVNAVLSKNRENAARADAYLSEMTGKTKSALQNATDYDPAIALQNLRGEQQGWLISQVKYWTDTVSNYFSKKIERIDNHLEECQMSVRNGGYDENANNLSSIPNNQRSYQTLSDDEERGDNRYEELPRSEALSSGREPVKQTGLFW